MDRYNFFLVLAAIAILLMWFGKCKADGDWTGREYMPDMAHSQAYETYIPGPGSRAATNVRTQVSDYPETVFADGKIAREPVKGTIPKGFTPYNFANDTAGYTAAGLSLINPFGDNSKETLAEGKELYGIYCAVCHGDTGIGNGSISITGNGPFAGVPNYYGGAYLQMSEGKMFHSIHYGKADMGSYASQLTKDERWKVVSYIKDMQAKQVVKDQGLEYAAALNFVRGRSSEPVVVDGFTLGESNLDKIENGVLKSGSTIRLNNVFFATGSANLSSASHSELNKLTEILRANPGTTIELAGHTDNVGDASSNEQLSNQRAKAVFDYLVKNGVGTNRMQHHGYGASDPAETNETDEGRAANRRTELKVL